MDAETIVRALAAGGAPIAAGEIGGDPYCALCDGYGDSTHYDECVWAQAQAWVAEHPTSSGAVPDLDPQEIGGVVGIYIVPEAPGQQPCLALRVLGGQKAYMRLWLRPPPTRVEWGWTLAKGAECLWTNPELDDTPAYRPPEGA